MGLRTMVLELDDADFDTIQAEITRQQVESRNIAPHGPTIIPDGESNLAGAIIADSIRSLDEYRAMWEAENPPRA